MSERSGECVSVLSAAVFVLYNWACFFKKLILTIVSCFGLIRVNFNHSEVQPKERFPHSR